MTEMQGKHPGRPAGAEHRADPGTTVTAEEPARTPADHFRVQEFETQVFDYVESESGCIARGGNAAAAPNTSSFS